MRRLLSFLLAACLALPAFAAERLQRFGDVDVHYSVFNSSFLQPEIAAASGLIRGKQDAVLNVAVMRKGKAVPNTLVTGEVKNLLGQSQPLTFRRVTEGDAAYHLTQFKMTSREILTFDLTIQENGQTHRLNFNQEVFPDDQ